MAIKYNQQIQQITYDPVVLPTEPGMEDTLNNMIILYANAGIVQQPRMPPLPDPVSNTRIAYQTKGLSTNKRAKG